MGDIGEVASAISGITSLAEGIIEIIDRDSLKKELDENITKIQNSFAENNLDDQWIITYRLFNSVGHPITPGGSVGDTERQIRHNALVCMAELKYARDILARLTSKSVGK